MADTPGPAIIRLPSCRDLNLVVLNCEITQAAKINTKDDLQRQYPDRFEGIGKFRGDFHITLDATVTPVIHAVRRCSIHLKDEVKAELDNMEELGVIERVTEPTDWVSSIVYSRKPSGKLRICLDPKDLNKAIKRPHYHTPTLEEITHKLAGSVMYSKLDARHGYWAVQLDEESRLLTTFNSPFGRYCYKRMPFGLNLSQDVFQERMDNILEHCPGTISIADDIGVFGSSEGDHDENLHNLMRVAQAHGLIFNAGKCEKLQANVPIKMIDRRANREDVHERLLQRQLQQKSYHESRGTRSLPELIPDQHVRIRDHVTGSWKPAIVKDVIADEPRSYNVEQPSGGILRRNRRHIRTTGEHHQVDNGSDGGPSEGSDETRQDVPDDNANAERNATPPVRPERHVTFAPDRTYRTRSGRSVKPPRRLEL